MAITDLTNTTWNIPAGWTCSAGYGNFVVSFKFNGEDYAGLDIGYNGFLDNPNIANYIYAALKYGGGTPLTPSNSFIITITGGGDVTNTKLISWLEANATQVIDKVLELNPFLTNIANAIRSKKGTTEPINAQDFASEIENLPSGVDDKTSYEQGYEDGSADALKDVTTLKGYLDIAKSTANSFANYTGTSVEGLIKYNDTSEVTNMNSMFYSCTNLTTIPLLNTNKVTRMDTMFFNCTKLTTIPALNTSNVTNMNSIFYSCTKLTTIPALDTSKVTNMAQMFTVCSSLTTIPLLNTSKVTRMENMFFNCTKLTTIPALDTSNVASMTNMFQGCSNLKSILMYGMKVSFNISSSTQFETSDLVTILNNLATVTSTQTLTMGATNLAKLTDEQKAIATNKGWTLA